MIPSRNYLKYALLEILIKSMETIKEGRANHSSPFKVTNDQYVYNIYYIQGLDGRSCLYSRAEIFLPIVVPRFFFPVNCIFVRLPLTRQ